MKKFFYLLIFLKVFTTSPFFSQELNISLFHEYSVTTYVISILNDTYTVSLDNHEKIILHENELLYISLIGDSLNLRSISGPSGTAAIIKMNTRTPGNYFSIRPINPALPARTYNGGLTFSKDINRILAINHVEMEFYLAGVVESEGGPNASAEYYKSQSILCRTYALANLKKHIDEGFHLCDGVHCQAYKNKNHINHAILDAAFSTKGKVVVFEDSLLITAAFHANCGGETQDSESEWLIYRPYLRSVSDPYCRRSNGATWQKIIDVNEWKHYLIENGFENSNLNNINNLLFHQNKRVNFYTIKNDSVSLRKIRNDWDLRSNFFSIDMSLNNNLIFNGKGFGHGIGLCQEGAMKMSDNGKTYKEIIDFYFQNVRIINYSNLLAK